MSVALRRGGCFCGFIRYEVGGTPTDRTNCHCSICRRTSGAPFVTWFTVRREAFRFTSGEPVRFASSEHGTRSFCPRCGTPLVFTSTRFPAELDVTAGSLDDPEALPPRDETQTSSRLRWVADAAPLPSFAEERPRNAVGDHTRAPWLGGRRGYLVDWLTQRWVQATGERLDLRTNPWLEGPVGETSGIGADFFETLSRTHGSSVVEANPHAGLMTSFDLLHGPDFSPGKVAPQIREFYEHTSRYSLDLWSQWHGLFRPFGGLLAVLFSRRLQQLNIPLRPLDTSRGMNSSIVRLQRSGEPTPYLVGWVRENPVSGAPVFIGAYSVVSIPGCRSPCVKVVFPLPNGNATVLMRPSVGSDGALLLESSGRRIGDPGFYLFVRASEGEGWVRFLRHFRERIRVYVDEGGELRTDHEFRLWGQRFLQLHYRLRVGAPERSSS